MIKAREQYNLLLDTDSLEELYPEMTGEWEKDKKKFIKEYEEMVLLMEMADVPINIKYDDFKDFDFLDEDLLPLNY